MVLFDGSHGRIRTEFLYSTPAHKPIRSYYESLRYAYIKIPTLNITPLIQNHRIALVTSLMVVAWKERKNLAITLLIIR